MSRKPHEAGKVRSQVMKGLDMLKMWSLYSMNNEELLRVLEHGDGYIRGECGPQYLYRPGEVK